MSDYRLVETYEPRIWPKSPTLSGSTSARASLVKDSPAPAPAPRATFSPGKSFLDASGSNWFGQSIEMDSAQELELMQAGY